MRALIMTVSIAIIGLMGANAQVDFDVRLADGRNAFEGRVEVFLNGEWGTICDDGWDFYDATAVCDQLGHSWALLAVHSAQFGQVDGPIHLTDVSCLKYHTSLQVCSSSRTVGSCDHRQDAGVVCHGDTVEGPPVFFVDFGYESDIPGGSVVLEIDYISKYSVCTDGWDLDDASVACRSSQSDQGVATAAVSPPSMSSTSPEDQFLTDFRCTGFEEKLHECPVKIASNCTNGRTAGATCTGPDTSNYPLRLKGSDRFLEGRVEVYFNDAWGTVCDDGWDLADATVVCRQLGYGEALKAVQGTVFGGSESGDIVFDDVECTGSESNLYQCKLKLTHNCDHSEDAGVVCSGLLTDPQDPDGDIRLVDEYGPTTRTGVVEMYYNSRWNRICKHNSWNQNAANVACHQLGYSKAASYGTKDIPSKTVGYLESEGAQSECLGNEAWLMGCLFTLDPDSMSQFLKSSCDEPQNAMIECEGMPKTGDLQLVSAAQFGRQNVVQVYNDGAWGTICNEGWTDANSDVVCQQLNLGYFMSYTYAESSRYVRGPIHLSNVTCRGTEIRLLDCTLEDWGSSPAICSHQQNVGIRCSIGVGLSAAMSLVIVSALVSSAM